TVCALVLGLVFSNIAQAAGMRMTPPASGKTGAYALCLRHLGDAGATDQDAANEAGDERFEKHKCPGCCLAASLENALPPERLPAITRPAVRPPVRVDYYAASPRAPDSLLFRAAHGARAPPA
ncbi:MAG: hypothetical protein N2444_10295, partial [Methylocystis sp.]|nr:hypothetical protein [Methylocystis sp.]